MEIYHLLKKIFGVTSEKHQNFVTNSKSITYNKYNQ